MSGRTSSSLPAGWAITTIDAIAEVNPRIDKSAYDDDAVVSFVPMPAVEAGTNVIDLSHVRAFGEVKKGYTPFRERDVLFAKITPCMENGKMAVVPSLKHGLAFGSTEFHVLRPHRQISPAYLYYFVSSQRFRLDAEHNMTGAVGQRRVPTSFVAEHPISLPPTAEQLRIATKCDELLSRLDKGIENIRVAGAQLAAWRAAALQHAFRGRITDSWRRSQADIAGSSAIIERVGSGRSARYQQQMETWDAALEDWSSTDRRRPAKPAKPATLQDISPTEQTSLPPLPDGWAWVRLGALIDEPQYGTAKKCNYNFRGTGVLRIPNVVNGVIDSTDLKGAEFDPDEIATYALKKGDILLIRSNGSISIVGKCALVSEADEQFLYAGYLIRLRPNPLVVLPEYLAAVLSSHLLRSQIEAKAKSTSGVNNINSGELQSLIVPLCSVDEQREVVALLSKTLSTADALDAELSTQLAKAAALRQAILQRAFSGGLVPQDPADEPASVLLERVSAERAASVAAGATGKRRASTDKTPRTKKRTTAA